MAKSEVLIDQLKIVLKQQGMTYSMLASRLNISEASVKRIFSKYHCSLERLDEICEALGIDVIDLANLVSISKTLINHLTEQQEQELVKNEKLLLVAVCARNHLAFEEIIKQYDVSDIECTRLLAHLDRIHFLELLPNNRIKLLVAADFRWLPNGPVERFYAKQVQEDYFNYAFSSVNEQRIFLSGYMSEHSSKAVNKKINALASEFQELTKQDYAEELSNKANYAMVLSIRPWELQSFEKLRR
ncbi:MAG: helix-turn-helix transcriptional regulator [Pseudomonadota bacterium]